MDGMLLVLSITLGSFGADAVRDASRDHRPVVVERGLDAPQIAAQSLASPLDGRPVDCVLVAGGQWTCSPPR